MYKVQMQCYEDAKLMKVFPEVVRTLYELDVLAEDTILLWYRKGTNPKGRYYFVTLHKNKFIKKILSNIRCNGVLVLLCRQMFVKGLEPFVNWLEEAEEEE